MNTVNGINSCFQKLEAMRALHIKGMVELKGVGVLALHIKGMVELKGVGGTERNFK
jgi:hypothetical protein